MPLFFVCLANYEIRNRGSCKEKLGFPRITGSKICLTNDLELVFFAYLSAVDGTKFCECCTEVLAGGILL